MATGRDHRFFSGVEANIALKNAARSQDRVRGAAVEVGRVSRARASFIASFFSFVLLDERGALYLVGIVSLRLVRVVGSAGPESVQGAQHVALLFVV